MIIKPGLVLKNNKFRFGYTIVSEKSEDKNMLVTVYNNYFVTFFDDCNKGEDTDKGLEEKLNLGKLSCINEREFKRIKKAIKYTQDKFNLLLCDGLEKLKLYYEIN